MSGETMPVVIHDHPVKTRSKQIRAPLARAVRLIITEGFSVRDAAKVIGYNPESLRLALMKPHVKAFRADVKRAWMDAQTEKAWLGVANLAFNAKSEDVRLKAQRTLLEAAGELAPGDDTGGRPTAQLIQIARAQIVVTSPHPPTERMLGVVSVQDVQGDDEEPLDR